MIRNYTKIALRNARRNMLYAAINILGLALSMTCAMLILIYLRYETSFDKYHANADSLFRVVQRSPGNFYMDTDMYVWTQAPLAGMLKENFPEVIRAARVEGDGWQISLNFEDKNFNENKFYFTDPDFLRMFSFPLIKGNLSTALDEPFSLLVTRSAAERYFGNTDPSGKIIRYNDRFDFQVMGVLEDVPSHSHFRFDFLASFKSLEKIAGIRSLQSWGGSNHATYVQLVPGADVAALEARIPEQVRTHRPKFSNQYVLQPLASIHLGGNIPGELEPNSHVKYVYIFSAVALFILIIGCFNSINLSTARSVMRAKEVGVRKVVGAGRPELVKQFLGESVLYALLSFAISLGAAHLLVGWFGRLMGRDLTFNLFREAGLGLGFFSLAFLVGLLSGLYPAFLLSSFQPVTVFRGKLKTSPKKISVFRSSFVVTQFVISTALIIASVVVFRQMEFIHTKDWGFDKEQIITHRINGDNTYFLEHAEAFKSELVQHPRISTAATSSFLPSDVRSGDMPTWEGKQSEQGVLFHNLSVDSHFLDLYGIELLAGRTFSDEFATDKESAFIVNETAVRVMDLKDPVGTKFGYSYRMGQIIGVVKDFHFVPLHLKIRPLAIHLDPSEIHHLSIKIQPEDFRGTMRFIRDCWKKFSPGFPLDFTFIDEEVNRKYTAEQRMGRTFSVFTSVAIFLACIGLFGLISFSVERRVKEIGIRKVIGASLSQIMILVTRRYILWVLMANLFAWPVAYLAMHKWLQVFAYRIELGFGTFILSTLLTFIIALFTLSYQSIRAASSDPVKALRYE